MIRAWLLEKCEPEYCKFEYDGLEIVGAVTEKLQLENRHGFIVKVGPYNDYSSGMVFTYDSIETHPLLINAVMTEDYIIAEINGSFFRDAKRITKAEFCRNYHPDRNLTRLQILCKKVFTKFKRIF